MMMCAWKERKKERERRQRRNEGQTGDNNREKLGKNNNRELQVRNWLSKSRGKICQRNQIRNVSKGEKKFVFMDARVVFTLDFEHWYTAPHPGPWVCTSVMANSLSDPCTTSMLLSWFYLRDLILFLYVKFVIELWNRQLKINKIYF